MSGRLASTPRPEQGASRRASPGVFARGGQEASARKRRGVPIPRRAHSAGRCRSRLMEISDAAATTRPASRRAVVLPPKPAQASRTGASCRRSPRFGQDAETRALLEGERALPLQGSEVHPAGEAEAAFRHINARAFPCRTGKRKSAGLKERSSEIFPSRPRAIHADSGAGTGKGFLHERDGRFPAFLGKPEAAHFFRQAVEAAESRGNNVRLSLLPVKIRGKRRRAPIRWSERRAPLATRSRPFPKSRRTSDTVPFTMAWAGACSSKSRAQAAVFTARRKRAGSLFRAGKKTAQDKVQTDIRAQNGMHDAIRGLPFHGKGAAPGFLKGTGKEPAAQACRHR